MDRRTFITAVASGIAAAQTPDLLGAPGDRSTETAAPAWLGVEPLIIVGNWDSFPLFERRQGGQPVWIEAADKKDASEESVQALKQLGVTLATIPFFKGFGLEAERNHIAASKTLAGRLRKYGIKVGLYVGSTIFYETFLLEKPEAEEWFVPDYFGKPVIYDGQTFRKRVYFMHPGYVEYIKQVVRIGVEEFNADEFHFDNTSLQARPEIFQHPLAIEHFRTYLTDKYSAEERTMRLGFSDMKYVVPPKYDRPLTTIDDPLFQEFADFRCRQLNAYYATMRDWIRQLKSNAAVAANPSSGLSGVNTIWAQGTSYPQLLPHLDIVWTEEGDYAGVNQDGILVSKIRTYKTAAILNKRIMTYTAGSNGGSTLAMAESMAFNRQTLGMVGGISAGTDLGPGPRGYVKFFHEKFGYYRGVENVADVAVLYSYATMGFNNGRPAVSFMLFTQTLIQSRIPFDIIFDEQLHDLSKYRVLVLADQECLSDEQTEQIRKYVKQGGGLVATEQTSLYTPWRLRRREFGLKDLLQVEAPPWRGAGATEEDLKVGPVRNRVEEGRVVYVSAVKAAIEKPRAEWMTSKYWKLPLNWAELVGAVEWAAGGKFTIEVKAPSTQNMVVELVKQERRLIAHLLNYDKGTAVSEIEVDLAIPDGKRVSAVLLVTPDGDGETEKTAAHTVSSGRIRFTVPRLLTYTLAAVHLE